MIATLWPAAYGLETFSEIDSTQSEARRRAAAGEPGPLWIVARRQTAGYGRRGRSWSTFTGNLMASVLMRPQVEIARAAQISFVAALAVADLFDSLVPGRCTLKWPNDALLDGRKAAGILPDTGSRGDGTLDWLIVGFGVNLASSPFDAPYPTSSVAAITNAVPDFDMALVTLAASWDRRFTEWRQDGFAPIRKAWLARAHGVGQPVTVRLADETFEAIFEGLDDTGALVARLPGGSTRLIAAGDVFLPVA